MVKQFSSSPILNSRRSTNKGPRMSTSCIIICVICLALIIWMNSYLVFRTVRQEQQAKHSFDAVDNINEDLLKSNISVSSSGQKKEHTADLPESNRNNLPDLSKGGIVLFFHMPKAGGSSIRAAAQKHNQVEYHSNEHISMEVAKKTIQDWTLSDDLIGEGKKVKFFELHWELESVVAMEMELNSWRAHAKLNEIPFFVLTIVRDPYDAYISFYNFFCIFLSKAGHVLCPGPHSVEHMIEISPDNPQTRWLCYATTLDKVGSKAGEERHKLPVQECLPRLFDIVGAQFDWIGTQKRMIETVGVLRTMGLKDWPLINNNHPHGFKTVQKQEIDEKSKKLITSKLLIDQQLFTWANARYQAAEFDIDEHTLLQIKKKR